LGQRILQNLAFQLGGQIVLEHGDGTVATMVFRPRTEAAARVKA
jgi:two-component sensor histidine kinase